MATIQTSQFGGSKCPRAQLVVTQTASTNTTVTLTWTLKWVTYGYTVISSQSKAYTVKINGSTVNTGTFAIGGKTSQNISTGTVTINKGTSSKTVSLYLSFAMTFTWSGVSGGTKTVSGSIGVAAKTSYSITYNANGGSGAPTKQTKWNGTNVTLSSAKPTRSGYTFTGWATSSSGSVAYQPGASYSANASVTLYAKWNAISYTVSYNANGGSGAPSNQTKTYNVNLTLSSTIPTRSNYNFKGWSMSSTGEVSYSAGATYTGNKSITLYAIWELYYTPPKITNLRAARCDSDGTLNCLGLYGKITFDWLSCGPAAAFMVDTSINLTGTDGTVVGYGLSSGCGTGESISEIIGGGTLNPDNSYVYTVTATDATFNNGSVTKKVTLPACKFPIDFLNGGTGVAFGRPSTISGYADFGYKVRARDYASVGNKTGYFDGQTGILMHPTGYMHIQRSDGNPYITFIKDSNTTFGATLSLERATNYLRFADAIAYWFDQSVYTDNNIGIGSSAYDSTVAINTMWKDGSRHNLVEKNADGLSSYLGWAGSATYSTITNIRGRTCRYSNSSGTTTLSDIRLKKDFTGLSKWDDFFELLEPCAFKMKAGSSNRYHIGFKAQQVEKALEESDLTTNDFAGFIKFPHVETEDDPENSEVYEEVGIKPGDDEYGLIYTEFVALNTYKIQKQQEEIDELKAMIAELRSEICSLKEGK